MRIAVVFDTPNDGWEDEDFKREVAAEVDEAEYEVAEALMEYGHDVLLVGVHDDLHHMFVRLAGFRPELVFNCAEAFHERPRLDYILPALLEAEGYHYTGSPPTSLQITRNKAMSKKLLAYHGVPVPRFVTFRRTEKVSAAPEIPFPLIVKPLQEDASAGIAQASIVQDLETLAERVHFIHESFSQPAIAEEFIDGRELYVSVLGNGDRLEVLPIIEMVFDKRKNRPEERIATKAAKWDTPYRDGRGIKNVFARPISQEARNRIEDVCRTAFRALWLRDYARVDVRLTQDDQPYVVEVNANPFISFGHDTANAAEKVGLDFYAFIDRIVQEALSRYEPQS
jgi:D-alanine-D-alanine ligase